MAASIGSSATGCVSRHSSGSFCRRRRRHRRHRRRGAGGSGAGRCGHPARRQPARVLRLRPVRQHRDQPSAGRPAAGRSGLHRVRHRDHRLESGARRRDFADRRHPHRQRPAAARRMFRPTGEPGPRHPAAGHPDPRHHAANGGRQAAHRGGAAGLPRVCARHRASGPQRGFRHALSADQAGRHRPVFRAAGARHLVAVGGAAPEPGLPPAGGDRRAFRCHGHRPPHRAGRCDGHRRGLPEDAAVAGRAGHPHAGAGQGGGAEDVFCADHVPTSCLPTSERPTMRSASGRAPLRRSALDGSRRGAGDAGH